MKITNFRLSDGLDALFGDEDLPDLDLLEKDRFHELPRADREVLAASKPVMVQFYPKADETKSPPNRKQEEAVVVADKSLSDVEQKWDRKYSSVPTVTRAISPIDDKFLVDEVMRLKKSMAPR